MQPESFTLQPRDWVPNHPAFAVLHYRAADTSGEGRAEAWEELLERNGWPADWRGGIFSYHHYHSTAHEALAIVSGSATVTLGGPGGREVALAAGELVVLPAGTGHCLVEAERDFLVIGAYPEGQAWDIRRDAPDEATLAAIASLPVPEKDPLTGGGSPLPQLWSEAGSARER